MSGRRTTGSMISTRLRSWVDVVVSARSWTRCDRRHNCWGFYFCVENQEISGVFFVPAASQRLVIFFSCEWAIETDHSSVLGKFVVGPEWVFLESLTIQLYSFRSSHSKNFTQVRFVYAVVCFWPTRDPWQIVGWSASRWQSYLGPRTRIERELLTYSWVLLVCPLRQG